jgi:hypothetical protein
MTALEKSVYLLASRGELVELTALLEEHPEVDVDGFEDGYGTHICIYSFLCVRLYMCVCVCDKHTGMAGVHSSTRVERATQSARGC